MGTKVYRWMLLSVIPYIRLTTYYTTLRGWKYLRGYKKLQPGHILVAVDKKKLTSILIPGEFTHAALCVSTTDEFEVAEMTHDNYVKSAFFDICKESDRVVILQCTDWDAEYTQKVIETCRSLHNASYDIEFEFGVQSLYCSELVYASDPEKRLKVDLSDIAGLGQPYISPTGLYKAKNVVVVWDSDEEKPS